MAGGLIMTLRSIAVAACLAALPGPAFASGAGVPIGFGPASNASWLAGAVAGYNWQRDAFVFGVEGDFSGTGLRSESTGGFTSPPTFAFPSADTTARIAWYGTVRAHAGWTAGSFLFYGTGGLAYGDVDISTNYNLGATGQAVGIAALYAHTSSVRVGWVAGAGVEYLVNRNLSVNFEYQYVDLGIIGMAGVPAPAPLLGMMSSSATVHAQFQTITIGLNWHFGAPSGPGSAYASMSTKAAPPPLSDPWAGLYAGGRAGGAWGNNLSIAPPDPVLPPR